MSEKVVVGIDGSDAAVAALRWAHEEARLRNADLEVVHAWCLPYVGDYAGMSATQAQTRLFRKAADHLMSSTLDLTLGDATDVNVVPVVVEGTPAAALLDAARQADLLVVGSRGRGGFAGLLLGSVSQQCVHHASCPVVVVHPAATDKAS